MEDDENGNDHDCDSVGGGSWATMTTTMMIVIIINNDVKFFDFEKKCDMNYRYFSSDLT